MFRNLLPSSVASFEYNRGWIFRSTLFLAVAVVWIMLLIIFMLPFDPIAVVVMASALAVFFVVVGVSPALTEHEIDAAQIVLRQGWHFSISIPLENVKAIELLEKAPKDSSRFISKKGGTLNITASKTGLISLKLRRPQRFASVFWRRADEVVLDVKDREAFRKAFEKALTATRASPTLSSSSRP
jgi:hypothetical protein